MQSELNGNLWTLVTPVEESMLMRSDGPSASHVVQVLQCFNMCWRLHQWTFDSRPEAMVYSLKSKKYYYFLKHISFYFRRHRFINWGQIEDYCVHFAWFSSTLRNPWTCIIWTHSDYLFSKNLFVLHTRTKVIYIWEGWANDENIFIFGGIPLRICNKKIFY